MNFMLHFMATLPEICFCLVVPMNGIWSHVSGDIKQFMLPTRKTNTWGVLPLYQDKFSHVNNYDHTVYSLRLMYLQDYLNPVESCRVLYLTSIIVKLSCKTKEQSSISQMLEPQLL